MADVAASPLYHFERVDIRDRAELDRVFGKYEPDAVLHLAAESHVDRSIDGPDDFVSTNLVGTFHLEAARRHSRNQPAGRVRAVEPGPSLKPRT